MTRGEIPWLTYQNVLLPTLHNLTLKCKLFYGRDYVSFFLINPRNRATYTVEAVFTISFTKGQEIVFMIPFVEISCYDVFNHSYKCSVCKTYNMHLTINILIGSKDKINI